MANQQLDVLVIYGSLRKGSYNAALGRTLPALAPSGMKLRAASSRTRPAFQPRSSPGRTPSVAPMG
ncbi:MAG TPA: hypothetical protein VKB89_06660 [Xanthobacteraceae bacterium]|nr:hypothetical protein [Xanthobacteraceae bacterium]